MNQSDTGQQHYQHQIPGELILSTFLALMMLFLIVIPRGPGCTINMFLDLVNYECSFYFFENVAFCFESIFWRELSIMGGAESRRL